MPVDSFAYLDAQINKCHIKSLFSCCIHKLHYLSLLEVLQVCRALQKNSLILCFGDSQGHCLNILTHCLLTALTVLSARGVLKKPFEEKIIWFAFVQ